MLACCYRIYDVSDPDSPQREYLLANDDGDSLPLKSSSTTTFQLLGESAVAFDFGPAITGKA